MSVTRDQLSTSNTKSDSSTSERNYNYIQRKINEYKDRVVDGFFHGERDEKQESHYYKQGYDFGIVLYNKNIDKLVRMYVDDKE